MREVDAFATAAIEIIFAAHRDRLTGRDGKIAHDIDVGVDFDRVVPADVHEEDAMRTAPRDAHRPHARDRTTQEHFIAVRMRVLRGEKPGEIARSRGSVRRRTVRASAARCKQREQKRRDGARADREPR